MRKKVALLVRYSTKNESPSSIFFSHISKNIWSILIISTVMIAQFFTHPLTEKSLRKDNGFVVKSDVFRFKVPEKNSCTFDSICDFRMHFVHVSALSSFSLTRQTCWLADKS